MAGLLEIAQSHKKNCVLWIEIEYKKPIEQVRIEMQQERREFARDKTYVTPRGIYSTKRF